MRKKAEQGAGSSMPGKLGLKILVASVLIDNAVRASET